MDSIDLRTLNTVFDRIDINPRNGEPTIRGLRLRVAKIVGLVNTGYSIDEVVARYAPRLERDDVTQAIQFSTRRGLS